MRAFAAVARRLRFRLIAASGALAGFPIPPIPHAWTMKCKGRAPIECGGGDWMKGFGVMTSACDV